MASAPYDIHHPPAAEEWLALDEGERIAQVLEAHRRTGANVGQAPDAHAAMHVAVENRLAMGHAEVVAAYERFRAAGVDRHNTVHALASVMSRHMLRVLEQEPGFDQATADRDFAELDVERWKRKG